MEMVILVLGGIATMLIVGELRGSMEQLQRQRAERRESRPTHSRR